MKIEKFKVLLYLKKSGLDKNGKAPIIGRITVNRTMAQFSCKLSCTPSKRLSMYLWKRERTSRLRMSRRLCRAASRHRPPFSPSWTSISVNSAPMRALICRRERNIKVILKEGILREYDVCRHVKEDDHINYDVYNLELIIAVAFWIDSIENRAFREFIMQAIIKKQTNRPKFVCLWSKNIMV